MILERNIIRTNKKCSICREKLIEDIHDRLIYPNYKKLHLDNIQEKEKEMNFVKRIRL